MQIPDDGANPVGPSRAEHAWRRRLRWAAVAIAVLVLVVNSLSFLLPESPGASTSRAPGNSNVMSVEAGGAARGPHALVLGADYDFFSTVNGAPVRWSCSETVTVRLAGAYPLAAPSALEEAVAVLRTATGLRLEIGADAAAVVIGERPERGQVLVSYTTAARVRALSKSPDPAGVTSAEWNSSTGELLNAIVLLDSKRSSAAPGSGKGFTMLVHELAHALGLGHASERSDEVMDPVATTGDTGRLGVGDRYALGLVGCN